MYQVFVNSTQAKRINQPKRISKTVNIKVDPIAEWIGAQVPSRCRIIIPIPVVVQACLRVIILARKYSDAGGPISDLFYLVVKERESSECPMSGPDPVSFHGVFQTPYPFYSPSLIYSGWCVMIQSPAQNREEPHLRHNMK